MRLRPCAGLPWSPQAPPKEIGARARCREIGASSTATQPQNRQLQPRGRTVHWTPTTTSSPLGAPRMSGESSSCPHIQAELSENFGEAIYPRFKQVVTWNVHRSAAVRAPKRRRVSFGRVLKTFRVMGGGVERPFLPDITTYVRGMRFGAVATVCMLAL